jgi:hypothetical protein
MEIKSIKVKIPEGTNLILGQTHFIKTVEDIYEVMVNTVPAGKFGVAFCEASGPCLIRAEGNDEELKRLAIDTAKEIAAGHTFVVTMKQAYPINVLSRIKDCPEVCGIFCATANPLEVIVAHSDLGRGILGVIDGSSPRGEEGPAEIQQRKDFLRKIGYKL